MSDRTKQCKALKTLFGILHFLALYGPFLYFIPYGFITGEPVEKISLSITIIISLILLVITVILDEVQKKGLLKSITWILILGVFLCLESISTFVYIMAIVSILDELVLLPLYSYYKTNYITNREIDKRL